MRTPYYADKYHDKEYIDLVHHVMGWGVQKGDRTGTGTVSTFAQQMRFDLRNNSIPLLTTKHMHTKSIIHELLWFLAGDTNVKYLQDKGVRIWNEWADENGDLGPVYGKQWRDWKHTDILRDDWDTVEHDKNTNTTFNTTTVTKSIDQIANVIEQLRNNPNDRRIIVNAWNVGEIEDMALPPCHMMFQFWSREMSREERMIVEGSGHFDITHEILDMRGIPQRALSCHMYQRSCDVALGVPFNIAQYSILVHMIAQVTGHVADEFVWTGGDVHIYNNHFDGLDTQLERDPYPSPRLFLNPAIKEIDDFTFEDFEIVDYKYHPTIKMEVSV